MKKIERIEIFPNGRIQVKTKKIEVLKLEGGATREIDNGTHRLSYNPGEVIGDDGGDSDLVDDNGLLQKAIESIPKQLKVDYLQGLIDSIEIPEAVTVPKLPEEPTDEEIKAARHAEMINKQRTAALSEKKIYEDKIKAL